MESCYRFRRSDGGGRVDPLWGDLTAAYLDLSHDLLGWGEEPPYPTAAQLIAALGLIVTGNRHPRDAAEYLFAEVSGWTPDSVRRAASIKSAG